ncbi:MAG: hypothetical protein K2Q03_09850 [Sphingobacteriaceae bacterium]|nr:hypothetical protein [Sphingobacteriaceae bacterium]
MKIKAILLIVCVFLLSELKAQSLEKTIVGKKYNLKIESGIYRVGYDVFFNPNLDSEFSNIVLETKKAAFKDIPFVNEAEIKKNNEEMTSAMIESLKNQKYKVLGNKLILANVVYDAVVSGKSVFLIDAKGNSSELTLIEEKPKQATKKQKK